MRRNRAPDQTQIMRPPLRSRALYVAGSSNSPSSPVVRHATPKTDSAEDGGLAQPIERDRTGLGCRATQPGNPSMSGFSHPSRDNVEDLIRRADDIRSKD